MQAEWFAGRLRELREAAGLTQPQLAARAGLSVRQVSRFETGVQDATWPTILALCQALDVDCKSFMTPPATVPAPARGRPRKAQEPAQKPKRPRGRPKK